MADINNNFNTDGSIQKSFLSEVTSSIPNDQLRALISLHLMLPSCWLIHIFKNPTLKMAYCLIMGLLFQYYLYGSSTLHVITAAFVNLAIIKYCPQTYLKKVTFIYNFGHNSFIHLYRLLFAYNDWSIEISTIFMMTIWKFIGFTYAYHDGLNHSKGLTISEEQKKFMVENFSTFEYFSYVFFLPTSLCGPFFEFNDFIAFIKKEGDYAKLPSTIWPSLKRISTGLAYYLIFNTFKDYADPDKIIDSKNEYTFGQKAFFYFMCVVHELKYIGGFCLAEAGVVASGISFTTYQNPKSKKPHDPWSRVKTVSIYDLQMIYKPSEFFHHWNISVHVFLKRYIYVRLLPSNPSYDDKQFASSATFFISAIWHGFHPTYFVVFLHFYLFTLAETQLNSFLKKFEISENIYFYLLPVVRLVIVLIFVPYHCIMFICLDFSKLMSVMKTLKFGLTLGVVFFILLMMTLNKLIKKPKMIEKQK
jgi:D-alanyl-lipoteichoic acid acyltransferase DltB (MBOAT superfamily)